jgi:hypothetical protein
MSAAIVLSAVRRRSSSRMRVSSRTALQDARSSALARSRRSAGVRTSSAIRSSLMARVSSESAGCASRTIAADNYGTTRSAATANQPVDPRRHVDKAACQPSSTIASAASRDTRVPFGGQSCPRARLDALTRFRPGTCGGLPSGDVRRTLVEHVDTGDPSFPNARQCQMPAARATPALLGGDHGGPAQLPARLRDPWSHTAAGRASDARSGLVVVAGRECVEARRSERNARRPRRHACVNAGSSRPP